MPNAMPADPPRDVELLELSELMKHPQFQELFEQCKKAASQVTDFAKMLQDAYQENTRLKAEIAELQQSSWKRLGYVEQHVK